MYVVTVQFSIKPEHRVAFDALMLEQAKTSLQKEPACHVFDVCRPHTNSDQVFLYEVYEDCAAFDIHLQSEHFKAFDAAVAAMIAGKKIATMDRVSA